MKVFPIKVEKAIPTNHKFIEWKIHNVCNHNCSFCGDKHKDGSQRWLSLETYKNYTDKLVNACGENPFWIQITGGEPTLFPDLLPLLQYIKSKKGLLSIISNGSRTLRYWEEIKNAKVLDYLHITYHSEQTDNYQHIAEVLNLFHDEPIEVICLVTHVYSSLDKAIEACEYILNHTGAIINLKSMFTGSVDIYDNYTTEELKKVKYYNWVHGKLRSLKTLPKFSSNEALNQNLKVIYNKGNLSINIDAQLLMKTKQNKFTDWDCNIGNNSMRIDRDIIYRGVCEVGEKRNLNDDSISFMKDYITCTNNQCFCGTDLIATKILPKHLFPQ